MCIIWVSNVCKPFINSLNYLFTPSILYFGSHPLLTKSCMMPTWIVGHIYNTKVSRYKDNPTF